MPNHSRTLQSDGVCRPRIWQRPHDPMCCLTDMQLSCVTLRVCCAALDFQFKDPDRNFDRSSVKGMVASLVRLKDIATTTALEVAAGGKLYQVVVDSDRTAQALLSRGQLRNRVTIIPLNKVCTSDRQV